MSACRCTAPAHTRRERGGSPTLCDSRSFEPPRDACHQRGHLRTGEAYATPGFALPATTVVHAVGPCVTGDLTHSHCAQLVSCYRNSLDAAAAAGARSIAFCCISTGLFTFPPRTAAALAVHAVSKWLAGNPAAFDVVVFDVFSAVDEEMYLQLVNAL